MEIITSSQAWNVSAGTWVGGHHPASNLSRGYHGLLKQWWDYYGKNKQKWLLLSENNTVKKEFQNQYPDVIFKTSDFYPEMNSDCDYAYNVCDSSTFTGDESYDIIISQAMFEHLYDPVSDLKNITNMLSDGGYLLLHTVVPGFKYHQFPRDYFRFYPDWFIDAEKFIKNIRVKELCVIGHHIFVVYQKNTPDK